MLSLSLCLALCGHAPRAEEEPRTEPASLEAAAVEALDRAIGYFHSISTRGGYVYYYSLDLKQRWGESPADSNTIEVQAPGTPRVGDAFLRAYRATGKRSHLEAARDAAGALIEGQNERGGWAHTIDFSREPRELVSFDDNQTQGAIRFLMRLDAEVDEPELSRSIERALELMRVSQLKDGGWPHLYPKQGNYHDFSTFNDGGINDCITVMIEADRAYGKEADRESLRRAGRFLLLSQLPPPQPGWAQQYNEYLQPAWARSFEPPSVSPLVTLRNVETLIELYLHLGNDAYLELIPDALAWVRKVRLPSGLWPRFAELGTDRPLYYDRGRIRFDSLEELSLERRTGYGYELDLSERLAEATRRFESVRELGRSGYLDLQLREEPAEQRLARLKKLEPAVREAIASLDSQGRWIVSNDRFRKTRPGRSWNGEYNVMDRLSSRLFCSNVDLLCEFLELRRGVEP